MVWYLTIEPHNHTIKKVDKKVVTKVVHFFLHFLKKSTCAPNKILSHHEKKLLLSINIVELLNFELYIVFFEALIKVKTVVNAGLNTISCIFVQKLCEIRRPSVVLRGFPRLYAIVD